MIRIQLRARTGGSRRALLWGVCLGGLLGGGGAWLMVAHPGALEAVRWRAARIVETATAMATTTAPAMTGSTPAAARGGQQGPDVVPSFAGSDAPRRILDLGAQLPSTATVQLTVGTARGGWAIEGRAAAAADLEAALDRLRRRTLEARLTHWRSGDDDHVRFRYTGRLLGEPAPDLAPLAEADAGAVLLRLRGLAEVSGLRDVSLAAEPDSSLGRQLHLRRWSLQAGGTHARIRRLLQDLDVFGGQLRLSRIDLVPGSAGQQLHARIDMLVTRAGDER